MKNVTVTDVNFNVVNVTDAGFAVVFDETTNLQNKKQINLLIRHWCEEKSEVITAYAPSLMFGRSTHEEV